MNTAGASEYDGHMNTAGASEYDGHMNTAGASEYTGYTVSTFLKELAVLALLVAPHALMSFF